MTINYDLIDSYLANQMNGEELAAFELEILDNPALQTAILNQRTLKSGLKNLGTDPIQKNNIVVAVGAFFRNPVWSCAATFLLAFCLGILWLQQNSRESQVQIDRIVYLESMRGTATPIYTIDSAQTNLLVVDIDPNSKGPYQVDIKQNGKLIERQQFATASDYSLNVLVPPLALGEYALAVTDGTTSNEYRFTVSQ